MRTHKNKENLLQPLQLQQETPSKKRSRSPTGLQEQRYAQNTSTLSQIVNSQSVWSPAKKKKATHTKNLHYSGKTVKNDMIIQIFQETASEKKIIELDRPEAKETVETIRLNVVKHKDGTCELTSFESPDQATISVKVMENAFNNVVYFKFLTHLKIKVTKPLLESFTYKSKDCIRRVCLLESAGKCSLQDYIYLKCLDVLQLPPEELKQLESLNKRRDFLSLVASMLQRRESGSRRNMKHFAHFFEHSPEKYDAILVKLLNLKNVLQQDMKGLVKQCIKMAKSLYDFKMIHNDTVYQNIFVSRSKKGHLKARFIDFDISSSWDSKNNVLYVPKFLRLDEDGYRTIPSDLQDFQQVFDYFVNKTSTSLDDVEYFLPTMQGDDCDPENKIVYMSSLKEDRQVYDEIWEIIHDVKLSLDEKWTKILELIQE